MGTGRGQRFAGRLRLSAAAGLASIGAGTIHAAAAEAHADHASAPALFAALAACQIGWGLIALASDDRRVLLAGALGNLLALGGWIAAKAWGVGFVRGLEHAEPAQLADSLAAGLAAIAVAWACAAAGRSRRGGAHRALGAALAAPFAVILAGAAAAGVLAAPGHAHGDDAHVAGAQHPAAEPGHGRRPAPRRGREDRAGGVDLSGVDGVTPAQQARAERLVAATRRRLPAFSRVAAAEAAGYVPIGDAISGHEHYVKWSYIDDGRILDPRRAESLVYRVDGATRSLVAAMYMLGEDASLDTVPDVGGRLTQWHVHDDLCFTAGAAPVVAGLTAPGGECPPPLVKRARVPMLHVWIVPHECGPFAALDGVAGGQVRDGEQPRCHDAHRGR